MREHGTYTCYVWGPEPGCVPGRGCRCDRCREAVRVKSAENRKRTAPAYVAADQARAHVEWLATQGVGLKTIAKRSGVAHGTLWKLIYGVPSTGRPPSKRITRKTEDAILAVTPADAADGATVDRAPFLADIATLKDRGWTQSAIARAIGMEWTGNLMPRGPQVTAGRARAVHELLDLPVPARRSRWGEHEVDQPEPEANDVLAEVIKARTEVDALPIIDPAVFDAEWRRRAACRTLPEGERWVFWPDPSDTQAIEAAKGVCANCAVAADCLTYALDAGEQGIWGGTTDDERAYLLAVSDEDDRWIHERYTATHCDRVYPTGAWCDREAGHKGKHHCSAEQGGGASPVTLKRPIAHGTEGGYRAHRRRRETACEDCKTANRLAQADRRAAAA